MLKLAQSLNFVYCHTAIKGQRPTGRLGPRLGSRKMTMTLVTDSVLERLPKQKLRCLRRIDRANGGTFTGDLDTELDAIMDDLSTAFGAPADIFDPLTESAIWRREPKTTEEARDFVIPLGIGGQYLILRCQAAPSTFDLDVDFARTAAIQLGNLFEAQLHRSRAKWLDDVESDFFEHDLHPKLCLDLLTLQLPHVFPKSRLFRYGEPEVQLLLRPDHDESTLLIAASTGAEAGSRVLRDDSVVGLVFEQGANVAPEHILGDPESATLRRFYKGFTTGIRSELVLALRRGTGRTIAALNFERREVNSFTIRELEFLKGIAPRLTLMVDALRRQIASDEHSRFALASAQSHYWESVGRILRHDLRNPTAAVGMALEDIVNSSNDLIQSFTSSDLILDRVSAIAADIHSVALRARSKVAGQENILAEFGSQFDDYLRFDSLDIRDLLRDAIRFASESLGDTLDAVAVDIEEPNFEKCSDTKIFASPLLKVFFFNVLENSIYWIRQGGIAAGSSGRVQIDVADVPPTGPVAGINRYIQITFADNGPGAAADVIAQLNDEVPRTVSKRDGGEGYALQAFRDYVQSINGQLRFSTGLAGGFRVSVDLRLFQ
jgi:signal transduction histidine kinase